MSIFSAFPSPAKTSDTGAYNLSVVTANVADGDEVTMDSPVATDDNGNVVAWANIPGGGGSVGVSSGTDAADLTVNQSTGGATDVTVFALVE